MNSKEKGWLLQAYRQVLGSCILTGGANPSEQCSEIPGSIMWTPFAIDAKGGEMKTKGEMQTKGEHAHRGSMSCCHQ